ncbi:hypothetical protein F7725_023371 [Dissostichus mawsoni]|uniref:Uncharacterized protein n=1 Tax=Dissostichus mawsoni TaxID=36200 RepID=A0A7J5Z100_DISMA|nr:hypothetical protein F7725_023371 [Dissostichus mawsoni]
MERKKRNIQQDSRFSDDQEEENGREDTRHKYLRRGGEQQGVDSSQVGDIALDIPDREDTIGQALEKDTNMEI